MKSAIDCCEGPEGEGLLELVIKHFYEISYDKFGNYVAQLVQEHRAGMRGRIHLLVKASLTQLSKHPIAFNVVERQVRFSEAGARQELLEDLSREQFLALACHEWGNFVVQAFYRYGTDPLRRQVQERAKRGRDGLCENKYGCKVLDTLRIWVKHK